MPCSQQTRPRVAGMGVDGSRKTADGGRAEPNAMPTSQEIIMGDRVDDPVTAVKSIGVYREIALADSRWLPGRLPRSARPPAEYAFANLFLFRDRHSYRVATEPVPHLTGVTYDGERHALPLVPLDRAVADALLAAHDCLFPFGAEGVAAAQALGLGWKSAPADSDYIFDAQRMADLAGAKARSAQARAFAEAHSPTCRAATPALAGEMDEILQGWLADTGRNPADSDFSECRQAIALLDALHLEGSVVRTGEGEPVAFLLASRLDGGEHVVHFAKGRRRYSGAYPWMFARYAAASGARRLNFEQDLGKPGFAQAKRAYRPAEHRSKLRLFRHR